MKELLSELYQVLGELDAPAKVLDQVAAAIAGQPLPHATLLPFADEPARTDVARKIIELANDHFENGGSSVLRTANNCIAEIQELARVLLPSVSQAVHVAPQADALPDGDLPDAVIQATAEAIGSAYDCMRTWSAWGVGTMGPDDFLLVADDGDRVAEIARAVIGAWLADQRQAIGPALEAVPAAPVVKESLTADRQEAFRVGNLVTYNQDEYPGLGTWYVQLWEGESIAARVYGNDREELSRRVTALNVVPPPAPQKAEPVARDVLTAALNEMRDACSFAVSGDIGVKSADKVMAGVDIGPIVDRHAAQPPAVAVPGATDDELEEIAKRHGVRWDGDFWSIEDADLHPFMRAMLAAAPQGAGDFKTWDAGAHEWWLSRVAKKGGAA